MATSSLAGQVLRTAYQKSVAEYWNKEKDPVNLRLGDVDHYGLGDYDPSVLEGPDDTRDDRIISEMHRLETAQADILLDHLGPVSPDGRLLDAGCGRGGTSFMANLRFGCQVDGVTISEQQVAFTGDQARQRAVSARVTFHFRNMLDTGFDTGSRRGIWTNETTMYVDLFELFAEFSRLLEYGGRYVCITGCYNDVTGGRSRPSAATLGQANNHGRLESGAVLVAEELLCPGRPATTRFDRREPLERLTVPLRAWVRHHGSYTQGATPTSARSHRSARQTQGYFCSTQRTQGLDRALLPRYRGMIVAWHATGAESQPQVGLPRSGRLPSSAVRMA